MSKSTVEERETSSKRFRNVGIIIAILMIVLGILLIIWPVNTGATLAYIATIGFVIYGGFQIFVFIKTNPAIRNGWLLANGIIIAFLGVLILFSGPLVALNTLVFVLAFLSILWGISQIASYGSLKRALDKSGKTGAGWTLAGGIINLALGVLLIIVPLVSAILIDIFLGVYLFVGAIAFLFEVLGGIYGRKV